MEAYIYGMSVIVQKPSWILLSNLCCCILSHSRSLARSLPPRGTLHTPATPSVQSLTGQRFTVQIPSSQASSTKSGKGLRGELLLQSGRLS